MKQRKLRQVRQGPKPALTRLKELPSEERVKLMEILRANIYEKAEPLAEKLVGFRCSSQVLSKFYSWQVAQEELEDANDLVSSYEEFCRRQNPEWSQEKVRESAIAVFMASTAAKRDLEGFATIAKLDLDQKKEARSDRQLNLEREKFEFNAAEACLKQLPELKAISSNKTLTESQKVEQIRLKLFGKVPPAQA